MRYAKLAVPVLVVVAVAGLIAAIAGHSSSRSREQSRRKDNEGRRLDDPRQPPRDDALSPERRAARALHLRERDLPVALEAARRGARGDPDGRQLAQRRQAPRRSPPGGLQGRPALHVRPGPEARGHAGERLQGRRRLADRDGSPDRRAPRRLRAAEVTAATDPRGPGGTSRFPQTPSTGPRRRQRGQAATRPAIDPSK